MGLNIFFALREHHFSQPAHLMQDYLQVLTGSYLAASSCMTLHSASWSHIHSGRQSSADDWLIFGHQNDDVSLSCTELLSLSAILIMHIAAPLRWPIVISHHSPQGLLRKVAACRIRYMSTDMAILWTFSDYRLKPLVSAETRPAEREIHVRVILYCLFNGQLPTEMRLLLTVMTYHANCTTPR